MYFASATGFPNKIYSGITQGEFHKQFYNHNGSWFNTTLAKYVWYLKLKHNVMSTMNKICDTIFQHYKEVQIILTREI